jgi:hypothetical protein
MTGRIIKLVSLNLVFAFGLVVAFEIAARAFLPSQVEAFRRRGVGDDRALFVPKFSYVDMNGYYKISPNMQYVEVAYYPDGHGNVTKEYQCAYQSDALGFLSNSVTYERASVLLLGDSFAQGQGGCEWMSRLSSETRARLYSAAIQGHGFAHWEKIVADLSQLRKPQKILIVFTTDDFYRALSQAGESQIRCLNGIVKCTSDYWYPISDAMDETARERLEQRHRGHSLFVDPKASLKGMFPASFGLLRIVGGYERAPALNFANSVRILADFSKAFDLRLIWIRDREPGEKSREEAVAAALAAGGLAATHCSLPSDGYLPRDGHPNSKGYDELRNCVEKVVADWE